MPNRTKLTRRNFLYASGLATGGVALGSLAPEAEGQPQQLFRVRRDINDPNLSPQVVTALRAGVAAMKAMPLSNPRSWRAQANIHNNFCPHSNWFFLPWHRAYLLFFERICRQASGVSTFNLPYWDWTANPRVPAPFWGNAATNALMDTTRQIGPNDPASAEFVGQNVINNIMGITNFQTFASRSSTTQRGNAGSGELEGRPHNYIHGSFIRGNMATFLSPLDPIFWLHHANIDRIWAMWNLTRANTTNTAWRNFSLQRFFDPTTGTNVNRTVSSLLSTYSLGYRYATQPATPPIGPVSAGTETTQIGPLSERTVNQEARTGAPVSVQLDVTPALREHVNAATSVAAGARRTRLRLTVGVERPEDTTTAVRVFVNTENAGPDTPITDPGYVGTFAFFEGHDASHGAAAGATGTRPFDFDVTEEIAKLAGAGRLPASASGGLKVTVVPIKPDTGGEARVRTNSIQLEGIR